MPNPADITSGFLGRVVGSNLVDIEASCTGLDHTLSAAPVVPRPVKLNNNQAQLSNHPLNLPVLLITMLYSSRLRILFPTMKPGLCGQYLYIVLLLLLSGSQLAAADNTTGRAAYTGRWILNEKLSDDTDRQVEISIRESGGKPDSGGRRGKGRYKGGPPEQALYDHLSYDEILEFNYTEPEFRLVYEQDFERVFYSDNRKRVVSASGKAASDKLDSSFASWDGDTLLVESRPRDGGWINETYELIPETGQLRVTLELKPSSFGDPINIVRIYDRGSATDPAIPENSPGR